MISRKVESRLLEIGKYFPVVSLNGPRQSGKTTLIKKTFPQLPYVSMEDPDNRLFAENDARGFLQNYRDGAVLDEIQRSPHLFSYIQGIVDSRPETKYILSGSQNFLLSENISQSLAGRVGLLTLLPFSMEELHPASLLPPTPEDLIFRGSYPRVYDKNIPPASYYPNYIETYVERDVRLIKHINDLSLFIRFMKLCAGRVGQLLNYSSLANDTGVSVNTVKAWISVLEASYILFTLPPFHKNYNKRLIKSQKLYFYDTGLLCNLLQITDAGQLQMHHNRGGLFENLCLLEIIKYYHNRGIRPATAFWQNNLGKEVDIILEAGGRTVAIEVKSGRTFTPGYFENLKYWQELSGSDPRDCYVLYAGDIRRKTSLGDLCPWNEITTLLTYSK